MLDADEYSDGFSGDPGALSDPIKKNQPECQVSDNEKEKKKKKKKKKKNPQPFCLASNPSWPYASAWAGVTVMSGRESCALAKTRKPARSS